MLLEKLTLKQARVLANLTQEESAKKLGVSPNTLSNWERGKTFPRMNQIEMISKIYDVPQKNICFNKE